MNREIKFRAWDSINKEMRYPRKTDFFATGPTSGDFIDNWEEVMQYTGLKDSNGKEIYEGDIIKGRLIWVHSDDLTLPTMGVVEYCEGFAAFSLANDAGQTLFDNHIISTFEVIGNIYENPELLTSTS